MNLIAFHLEQSKNVGESCDERPHTRPAAAHSDRAVLGSAEDLPRVSHEHGHVLVVGLPRLNAHACNRLGKPFSVSACVSKQCTAHRDALFTTRMENRHVYFYAEKSNPVALEIN